MTSLAGSRAGRLHTPNIIFMSGMDLALIFGGAVELVDALPKKIDAAESRGKFQFDLTA